MTQEERQLLLVDLAARLPYGVVINYNGLARPLFNISPTQHFQITLDNALDGEHNGLVYISLDVDGEEPKPYLRPMSSMTEGEKEELTEEHKKDERIYIEIIERVANGDEHARGTAIPHFAADWCNEHHFDYRGLIEKGLAIAVTENNNPYKE